MIAPHPDDETLGAGGLIQRVLSAHGTVRVVLVTAGDGYVEAVRYETGELRPRAPVYVAYGERRLREARAAGRKLGGNLVRVGLLGFPDGGLEQLLQAHWWRDVPERSPTTGALRPPYPEALDRSVAYDGDDLRRELERVLRETRPTTVAFPDPLDRIPITAPRASSCYSRWGTGSPGTDVSRVSSRTSCTGPAGRRDGTIPSRRRRRRSDPWSSRRTSRPWPHPRGPSALAHRDRREGAALECYVTQQEVMSSLLAAFVRRTEPFTVFTVAEVRGVGSTIQRKARR